MEGVPPLRGLVLLRRGGSGHEGPPPLHVDGDVVLLFAVPPPKGAASAGGNRGRGLGGGVGSFDRGRSGAWGGGVSCACGSSNRGAKDLWRLNCNWDEPLLCAFFRLLQSLETIAGNRRRLGSSNKIFVKSLISRAIFGNLGRILLILSRFGSRRGQVIGHIHTLTRSDLTLRIANFSGTLPCRFLVHLSALAKHLVNGIGNVLHLLLPHGWGVGHLLQRVLHGLQPALLGV